jgi:N6-adenosine-specific RNA methylase IME4
MKPASYQTIVVDPPWRFDRQPKCVRPKYGLLDLECVKRFPIPDLAATNSHLYLWVPNALLKEGCDVMNRWGFDYKTEIIWIKHQMGVGNYYRNSSEPILFGVRGKLPTLRRDVRTWFLADRRQHSRKPDEFYRIVESMSPGPRIDVFSREYRPGWDQLGDQCDFFNQNQGDSNERDQTVKTNGSSGSTGCGVNDSLRLDERTANTLPKGRAITSV